MIFIDDEAKLLKFLAALTKDDIRSILFVLPSEDLDTKVFPKKANVMVCEELMPPPDLTMLVMHRGPTDEYLEKYNKYLHKAPVHDLINKIVGMEVTMGEMVVVCNTRLEREFVINKTLRKFIEEVYGIKVLKWSDIKDNIRKSTEFTTKQLKYYASISNTVEHIHRTLKKKIRELHHCDTPTDDFI